jgi:hypothetical protein
LKIQDLEEKLLETQL